jgi:ribosomal protein S12 methylthiotransferase accessory factor YcaO
VPSGQTETGLAARLDERRARDAAMREAVERTALYAAWTGSSCSLCAIDEGVLSTKMRDSLREACLLVRLYALRVGTLPAVAIAVVSDLAGDRVSCGSACVESMAEAAEHAVTEAVALRWSLQTTAAGRRAVARMRQTGNAINSLERAARTYAEAGALRAWVVHNEESAQSLSRASVANSP